MKLNFDYWFTEKVNRKIAEKLQWAKQYIFVADALIDLLIIKK